MQEEDIVEKIIFTRNSLPSDLFVHELIIAKVAFKLHLTQPLKFYDLQLN